MTSFSDDNQANYEAFKYLNLRHSLRKFEKKWEPKPKRILNEMYARYNMARHKQFNEFQLTYHEIQWISSTKRRRTMKHYILELERKYEYNSVFHHRNNTIKTSNKNKWQSQRIRKRKIFSKYKDTNIYVPNMEKYKRLKKETNYKSKIKPNLKKKQRYFNQKQSLKDECFAYWLQYKHIPTCDEYEYWINFEQCKDLKYKLKDQLQNSFSIKKIDNLAKKDVDSKWKDLKWIARFAYDLLFNSIIESDYPRRYMKKYVIRRLKPRVKPLIRQAMQELQCKYKFAFAEIDRYHLKYSKENCSYYLANAINIKGVTYNICSIILDFVSSERTMIWFDDLRQYKKSNCFRETYLPKYFLRYGNNEESFERKWLDGNDNDFPTKDELGHPDTIYLFYDDYGKFKCNGAEIFLVFDLTIYLRVGFMIFKGEHVYFYNRMVYESLWCTTATNIVFSKEWLNLYNWIKENCDYLGRKNEDWRLEMYSFLFE